MSERHNGFAVPVTTAAILRRLRADIVARFLDLLRMIERHRERGWLAEMDARMLRDIGVDRSVVWREARKWWWEI
ncbi:hypothetical protein [Roseomonas xinghualingensis]|uniref:hypothetical protein n=1 Tax=Roseomonas xinghualingensis TaxID=2986475 RepID=UPI0021F1C1BD|nr:hypothetical protein [Roseomonas sp. SXEYE001]MCV4209567.1 hypothetical protein [Roseomonas sp. SXEYE001]